MTVPTRTKLFNKLNELSKDKSKQSLIVYNSYVSKLRDNAKVDESKLIFESCAFVNNKFINVLVDLDKQLDELFQNDSINFNNTKLSHVVVFGVIEESSIFSEFCFYLFNGIIHDITGELNTLPLYRFNYLNDNVQIVANITNRMYTNVGAGSYMTCINNMKKENTNLLLVDENNNANTQFLKANALNINTKNLVMSGFIGKNLFRWFGEMLANRTHEKYKKLEQEKEWMEAQVALLRLDLDDVNPDDKQYRKLVKVIEAYDDLITKADKKINSYYSS